MFNVFYVITVASAVEPVISRLDDQGSVFLRGRDAFSVPPHPVLGPTQPPIQ
jgi:hypothetical protein